MSPPGCPACGSKNLTAHCPSFLCLWVKCDGPAGCGGFGLLDGSKWCTRAPKPK